MSILRSALISLSDISRMRDVIASFPASRRVAYRFVAGERLEDAIAAVLSLNAAGMLATLDHLGENVTDEMEARAAADEYILALEAIAAAGACSNVSIKLTQMGLDLGDEFCYGNVARIVDKAADLGNLVRIDMEGSAYTERTIALYRRLRERYGNVGIVIQAYLRRSQCDVERLIDEGIGHFRLCKGAYDEPVSIAFRDRSQVTQSLQDLIRTCLKPESVAREAFCAIASHDDDVINFTRAYVYQNQVAPARYEFQVLYGIRRDLQTELVTRGYKVRVYVPYGTHWYPYFMRRLAERPANLAFFARALVGD